ncbi:hypothetical protein B0O99DRAFT_601320 [Bisporella sp. PMI_857]|jgi:hypothetical protein|nr:hypothetical protein B0O99DRAFT_601320 [Bisporella sp. PMI_857]
MPSVIFKELNKNQSMCSAWLTDKDRCCQIRIAAEDQKKREQLLKSIVQKKVDVEPAPEELTALYFCKRFHRPTGTHPIQPSDSKKILPAILPHCSWEDKASDASQSNPPRISSTKGRKLPPEKPRADLNRTVVSQLLEEDSDLTTCTESSPELRPRSDQTKEFELSAPIQSPSTSEGSDSSTAGIEEQLISHETTCTATVVEPTGTKASTYPIQESQQPATVVEESITMPLASLLEAPGPSEIPELLKSRQSPRITEKATAVPVTSFFPAPQLSEACQQPKLRRSPRLAKRSTAAVRLAIAAQTRKAQQPERRGNGRIEKRTSIAGAPSNEGKRNSRKGTDLHHPVEDR